MKKITLFLIALLSLTIVSCDSNKKTECTQETVMGNENTEKQLTAQFFVKPECINDFKALTVDLISNTRKEEGAVSYNLYQSVEDSTIFIFLETFKNQAAFDAHLATEHFKKFDAASKDIKAKDAEVKFIR